MHPHRAEQDKVERQASLMNLVEVGQAIVEPADVTTGVPPTPLVAHSCRRFNCNDFVAERPEPRSIPA